jgi:hypothetical protein
LQAGGQRFESARLHGVEDVGGGLPDAGVRNEGRVLMAGRMLTRKKMKYRSLTEQIKH